MKRLLSCMLALTLTLSMMTPVSFSEEEITLSEIEEAAETVSEAAEEAALPEARLTYEDGALAASYDGEAVWYFQRVSAERFASLDAEALEAEWTNIASGGARLVPEAGYAYRAIAETEDGLFVSEPVVIAASEPEEKTSDALITYAEQITANSVKLVWQAADGAKSYAVYNSAADKTTVTTKTALTFTKLAQGQYGFTVTPCSDKKGKVPLSDGESVLVEVGDWSWAAAPAVTASVPNADEAVVTLTWTPAAEGADGFEVSDNKKTIIAETEEQMLTFAANGTKSFYVRPYIYAADGTKIYGTYSKAAKVKINIAWMKTKPAITAIQQTDEDEVRLTWKAIDGAEGYRVYEYASKTYTLIGETSGLVYTVTGVSYGKHSYAVVAVRENSLGTVCEGTYSAAKAITTKVLWSQAPALTVSQYSETQALLSWSGSAPEYQVYVGSTLLDTVRGTRYLTDEDACPLVSGKSYKFKVVPVKNGVTGTSSKAVTLKMADGWKIAPVLSAYQSGEGTVTLSWRAAGMADSYNIYQVVGKKTALIGTSDTLTYTVSGLAEGSYIYLVEPVKTVGSKVTKGAKSAKVTVTVEASAPLPDIDTGSGIEIVSNDAWHLRVYADGSAAREKHSYDDDSRCEVCGHECAHSRKTIETKQDNFQRAEIPIDDANHTLTYDVYTITTCSLCGKVTAEKTDTVTANEAHTYDEYDEVCTVCGHERVVCLHKRNTTTTENRDYARSEIADNDEEHTLTYDVYTVVTCDKCHEKVSDTKTDTVTTTEDHTYENDICAVCGHEKPASVISAAFEHCHVLIGTDAAITVTTSANAGYLFIYDGNGGLAGTWSADEAATETADGLVWNITYNFTEAGEQTLSFSASVGGARLSEKVSASVTAVAAGPAISSVTPESVSAYTVEDITFTVTTPADAETLTVRDADGTALQTLTADTDSEDGVWTVTLSFSEAGTYSLSFTAAYDDIYGGSVCRAVTVTVPPFTWTEIEGGARVTGYTGTDTAVTVPGKLCGLTVIEIGEGAFQDNSFITSIDLPDTVRKIGANAFANCSALREMK